MNILSFSRMKSYRKNGRVAIVLKLSLPRILEDTGIIEPFNNFYSALAEQYDLNISDITVVTENMNRPITVTVSFTDITEEYTKSYGRKNKATTGDVIVIKRLVRINSDGQVRSAEYVDIYNMSLGLFVK